LGGEPEAAPPADPLASLTQDLLLAANELRNRLLDDALIVQVSADDPLLRALREQYGPWRAWSSRGRRAVNLHIPAPRLARQQERRYWPKIGTRPLRRCVAPLKSWSVCRRHRDELRALIATFRAQMRWTQRLRESSLPHSAPCRRCWASPIHCSPPIQ
jgi:hypothetical protein